MAEDPLTTHARNRVGRVLRGKWTLDRLIGVGGMAAVYEATHRNGSKVAIKMLHPTLMYDTNFAHRLVQEGYVANKINHPAAVKVHDDDTDEVDGAVFLVMELLEGQTLSQARRKRKKFPAVEACKMIEPVLECLASAHEKSIIHRDIKPENLFLTREGQVRVLDFGIARINDGSNVSATRTGMVVGSPAYMSPEQALGKMNSVGPQTDVYAVGATLFALIAGTTPHAGESTQEMIVMVATQSARAIGSVVPDISPAIARVIDKSLAYDKDKRYTDARTMLEDLRAALVEAEGGPPRVLPTFAEDDDEGQTTVNNALKGPGSDSKPSAAAPLPAAGMNRVGTRPATGKFNVPVGAPEPMGMQPVAPPPTTPGPDASQRMRPPTLAPTGAPVFNPNAIGPNPTPVVPFSPGGNTGPQGSFGPGTNSGVAPYGAAPTPGSTSVPGADGLNAPINGGVPATMAMPTINPADLASPSLPGTSSGQHPGVSSGPRPGSTTNMAWAAPPDGTPVDAPAPRKPKTALIAAAAVGVLALGGIAVAAFSGSGDSNPPAPVARPARPPTPARPPVVAPTPPPVTPQPPPPIVAQTPTTPAPTPPVEVPAAADAGSEPSPTPVVAANTPEPTTPTPPTEEPDDSRNARRRNRDRTTQPAENNGGNNNPPPNRNRNRNRNHGTPNIGY